MGNAHGNILFLILIAVALFAALSYAVTQSTRSGSGSATGEKVRTEAARLLGYFAQTQSAVQRLQVINGLSITGINYASNAYRFVGDALILPMGTPANPSNYLFHPNGGGVAPQVFEDLAAPCPSCTTSNTKPGHLTFMWVNLPGYGTSASDALFSLMGIRQDVCAEINRQLGISTSIPLLSATNTFLPGTTGPVAVSVTTGSAAHIAAIANKGSFCWQENNAMARYIFSQVVQTN